MGLSLQSNFGHRSMLRSVFVESCGESKFLEAGKGYDHCDVGTEVLDL
jgi:hypothetical protein|eukprot:COSAG01_NODE_5764_length_4047_cov_3.196302_5_plen_48_part_00